MTIVPVSELEPIPQELYETWDSLQSVIKAAQQELPSLTPNELRAYFLIYHNTLLAQIAKKDEQ
jgi:hypothetical protein